MSDFWAKFLAIAVQVMIYIIPIISTAIGGILGPIVGFALNYLLKFVQLMAKFADIDAKAQAALNEYQAALERVKAEGEDGEALENFKVAASRLSRISV